MRGKFDSSEIGIFGSVGFTERNSVRSGGSLVGCASSGKTAGTESHIGGGSGASIGNLEGQSVSTRSGGKGGEEFEDIAVASHLTRALRFEVARASREAGVGIDSIRDTTSTNSRGCLSRVGGAFVNLVAFTVV